MSVTALECSCGAQGARDTDAFGVICPNCLYTVVNADPQVLEHMAEQQKGWNDLREQDLRTARLRSNESTRNHDTPRFAIHKALFDDAQNTADASGPGRIELPGAGDLLYRGQAATFFSDKGRGKSVVALTIAASVAAAGVKVFYFDRENGAAVTKERLEQIIDANGLPDLLASEMFVGRHYPKLSKDWDPDDFGETIRAEGFGLVIYDSVREAVGQIGGNPNSDQDISALFNLVTTPLVERGIAVLVLDNTGHDDKHRPKGAGAKEDAVPTSYKLTATEKFTSETTGRVTLQNTRSRFGDEGRKWTARLGGGVYEVPKARDEAPDKIVARRAEQAREKFHRAVLEVVADESPLGIAKLVRAAKDRSGLRGGTEKLSGWIRELAANPESGLDSTAEGYVLTPNQSDVGQGLVSPPEAPPNQPPLHPEGVGAGTGPNQNGAGQPPEEGGK